MKKFLLATCLAFTALAAAAAFSACTSEEEHLHDMTANQAVAATCTEEGNTAYYYCEGCGKYFSDEAGQTEIELSDTVVSATGHSTTLVGAVSATCTEEGNTAYYVCGNCGTYFSDAAATTQIELSDTVIPATGHSTSLVEAVAATCTEDGNTAYYVCENCGTYFSDAAATTQIELSDTVIPATGHSTSLVEAVAATCTEDGNTAYYVCENCGKYFSDEEGTTEIALSDTVIAASHTLTLIEAVSATCTEEGNTAYYVCSVCGEYFSDEDAATQIELSDTVVSATGHSTSLVEAVSATCTEDGNTAYYVCSVCGEYFSDEVGATQIGLSDTVVPATGHSTSLVEAVSATCTVDGNTAYYVCENCGEYFSNKAATTQIELSDTVIPATGHDTSLVRAVSATCTTAGSIAYYVCENCGKYFSQAAAITEITLADTIVAPAGHSLISVAAKTATCTEDGNTAYYECSVCGAYFSDVTARTEITLADTVISATGHNLIVSEDGQYYECEYCGKRFADENGNNEINSSSDSTQVTG